MASGRHLRTAVTQCWNPISPVRGPAPAACDVMWVTGYLLYCWLYVDVVYVVDTTRLWDLHWTIPLWLTARCPRLCSLLSCPQLQGSGRTGAVSACVHRARSVGQGRPLEMSRAAHTFIFPEILLLLLAAGCRTRVTTSLTRL